MKPYLRNIRQIQDIVWEDGTRWDVKFPDAPSPFDSWFPAARVEYVETTLNSQTFDAGQLQFEIPVSGALKTVTISFYDTVDVVLLNWLKHWIDVEILNNGKGITPVLDAVKPLEVVILDEHEHLKEHKRLEVFPHGSLSRALESDAQAVTRSLDFTVVNETFVSR